MQPYSLRPPLGEWPSKPSRDFRGRPLPELGTPAGYSALLEYFNIEAPLPPRLTAIGIRHHPVSNPAWLMLTPRHRPSNSVIDHLVFALKWEGVDFAVLNAVFRSADQRDLLAYVRAMPTGAYARRLWYLWEWLTGRELDMPVPGKVRLVPAVDPDLQVALRVPIPSSRHKVLDNIPGTPAFCPMVRRTPRLMISGASRLDERAREVIGRTRKDLISRAAAFLLLKDSKSSFQIEGERASGSRAIRWGQAIGQAGASQLSIAELERLQKIVLDARYVKLGLRTEGGFVGEHDRRTGEPIPDHIDARAEDISDLLSGIVEYGERAIPRGVDPVVAAAVMAFGFVYVHPFVDGNGRLHRWLIHHVLAASGYTPRELVFPVSAAILRKLDEYKAVLESYSGALLPFIEWKATASGNVVVTNETAAFYRYFDATAHAEFLYECVAQTVEQDLPEEVHFLEAFDKFSTEVQDIVDMPTATLELLRGFLEQNDGRLSERARKREFKSLTEEEVASVERLFAGAFKRKGPTRKTL